MRLFCKIIFLAGLGLVSAGGGGGASSGASSYASSSASSNGGGVGSIHAFAGNGGGGSYSGPPSGFGDSGFGASGFGFGGPGFPGPPGFADHQAFQRFLQDYLNQMQEWTKMQAQASANAIPRCASSDLGDRFGSGGGSPASGGGSFTPGGGSFPQGGGVGASASGSIGPGGGYGSASVYPPKGGSGISDRIGPSQSAGPFPAPSEGGTFGISSFSSSSSSDINGKKTSQKHASVSYNDNGKITTYTSHDP